MYKSKRQRRKWRIDLTVDPTGRDVSTPHSHSLNNDVETERVESRLHTLGNVIVNIAQRAEALRVVNGKEDVR